MITEMELQQQNIKELLELVQQNPDLRIIPLVDTECVPDDDYGSWVAGWGKARIEEVWASTEKERIYIKSNDHEGLVDDLLDKDEALPEEEAKYRVDNYPWEKVIIVEINTPL